MCWALTFSTGRFVIADDEYPVFFFIPSPRSCVLKIPSGLKVLLLLFPKSDILFSDLVYSFFNSIRSCVLILDFVYFLPITAFLCSNFGLCLFSPHTSVPVFWFYKKKKFTIYFHVFDLVLLFFSESFARFTRCGLCRNEKTPRQRLAEPLSNAGRFLPFLSTSTPAFTDAMRYFLRKCARSNRLIILPVFCESSSPKLKMEKEFPIGA